MAECVGLRDTDAIATKDANGGRSGRDVRIWPDQLNTKRLVIRRVAGKLHPGAELEDLRPIDLEASLIDRFRV